ncbi:MAG: hypothetical protein ACLQVL_32600 [Terriglobia bacterium]
MKQFTFLLLGVLAAAPFTCAQQAPSPSSDPGGDLATTPTSSSYTPPTQSERFKTYLLHTYGIGSILEAGVRAGINQARDNPGQWPEGAQGYGERFGSAMGEIAVRGTTEYLVGDAFKEDLRFRPCRGCSVESKFRAALEDTFTARKGDDGHTAFSVARLVGPVSGSLVAQTWMPSGHVRDETAKGIALTFGLVFARNLVRQLISH